MGAGRFGPVYRGHDPATGHPVLIRTFQLALTDEQRERLVQVMRQLCDTPLEHSAIARPLTADEQDGTPYLVHTYLPGRSLAEAGADGLTPAGLALAITQAAAAIDFAAAAGVQHGDLSAQDVIVQADGSAGVSGFGLVQCVRAVGLDIPVPTYQDDVIAFAGLVTAALGSRVHVPAVDPEGTALAFAASMQDVLLSPVQEVLLSPAIAPEPAAPTVSAPSADEPREIELPLREDPPLHDEVPLREEVEAAGVAPMFVDAPAPATFGWRWVALVAVAVALAIGFGVGFLSGRGTLPSTQTELPLPTTPAPTMGETDTREPVREAPIVIPPAPETIVAPEPGTQNVEPGTPNVERGTPNLEPGTGTGTRTRNTNPEPGTRNPEPQSSTSASILVESHPSGARVFMDGAVVGVTPMQIVDVKPGTHSVRLELPGHNRWVDAVTVAPGARLRVAASLEQQ